MVLLRAPRVDIGDVGFGEVCSELSPSMPMVSANNIEGGGDFRRFSAADRQRRQREREQQRRPIGLTAAASTAAMTTAAGA
jgi:hypothetical protein